MNFNHTFVQLVKKKIFFFFLTKRNLWWYLFYLLIIAPWLCIQNDITRLYNDKNSSEKPDCILVVDSGYSFTHIIPFVMNRPVFPAIRRWPFFLFFLFTILFLLLLQNCLFNLVNYTFRINIGGKLLTNHLKEIVSFR